MLRGFASFRVLPVDAVVVLVEIPILVGTVACVSGCLVGCAGGLLCTQRRFGGFRSGWG